MASALVYAFPLGLPLAGLIIAWSAILYAYSQSRTLLPLSVSRRQLRTKLIPYLQHSLIPFLFGFVMSFLISTNSHSRPDSILESVAIAVGIPSFLASIGLAIVYPRAVREVAKNPKGFARALLIGVLSVSAAIFGLVVSFLMLGSETLTVELAWLVASLISIGGIGAVLSAQLATSFDVDWCTTGSSRALVRGSFGECVSLVFFAFAIILMGIP